MSQMNPFIEQLNNLTDGLEPLSIESLIVDETVLIVSDMIKGFTTLGSLSSPRVGQLVKPIEQLAQRIDQMGIESVAFADAHSKDSPEFNQYPVHCVAGTEESELIEGLKGLKHMHLIHKNSTNGYLEPEFQRLLRMNPQWQRFIIIGNCTDICVLQLALTLKAHFNRLDTLVDVVIPVNLVDTFDSPGHPGDLIHSHALYLLAQAGMTLVSQVTL